MSDADAPETYYSQVVGHVVRGHRELQGLSLAEMAESIGLSSSGWSRVETGHTTMTVVHLVRAARRLGMPPWEIVRQADLVVSWLEARGVVVHDSRPAGLDKMLSAAELLALVVASSPEDRVAR